MYPQTAFLARLLYLKLFMWCCCAVAAPGHAGHWQGAIELPGVELEIRVELEKGPDAWQGTIDIPVAYEVMPGNTSDKTTLPAFLRRIENQYGKMNRLWIMDRGIQPKRPYNRCVLKEQATWSVPRTHQQTRGPAVRPAVDTGSIADRSQTRPRRRRPLRAHPQRWTA